MSVDGVADLDERAAVSAFAASASKKASIKL